MFPLGLLYLVLDGILKRTFEGVGPSWLYEELRTLATGAICLAGGVLLARSVDREPRLLDIGETLLARERAPRREDLSSALAGHVGLRGRVTGRGGGFSAEEWLPTITPPAIC